MKKTLIYLCLLTLLVLVFSNTSFGVIIYPPMSLSDTYKAINNDNGQSCFIIGGFSLVHTLDPTLVDPGIASIAENIDRSSSFYLRVQMKNTENNQTTTFYFKPVTGSNTKIYYPNSDKKLDENTKNPYWVAQLPEGNYEVTGVSCNLSVKKQGFDVNQSKIFDTPLLKLVNKKVAFDAGVKQIIYIGDYNASLISNVYLKNSREIYPYYKFQINLVNDFNTAKEKFIGNAYERVKEKLKDYAFVSVL